MTSILRDSSSLLLCENFDGPAVLHTAETTTEAYRSDDEFVFLMRRDAKLV